MPIDQDRIKKLISLVEANDLTELVVEEEGLSITIRAESPVAPQVVSVPVTEVSVGVECPSAELKDDEPPATIPAADESHLFSIESPMTGVFYRTPAPDQPHYIEIGDEIEAGQTIGLIEAMKLYHDVTAPCRGTVAEIRVQNAEHIEADQPLMVINRGT